MKPSKLPETLPNVMKGPPGDTEAMLSQTFLILKTPHKSFNFEKPNEEEKKQQELMDSFLVDNALIFDTEEDYKNRELHIEELTKIIKF